MGAVQAAASVRVLPPGLAGRAGAGVWGELRHTEGDLPKV